MTGLFWSALDARGVTQGPTRPCGPQLQEAMLVAPLVLCAHSVRHGWDLAGPLHGQQPHSMIGADSAVNPRVNRYDS
jgi:hypothetical protein